MSISPSNQYNMTTTQDQFRIYQNQMQQKIENLQKRANNIQYLYSTSSGNGNGADLTSLNERVGMNSTLNSYQGQTNLTDIVNALSTTVPPDITQFTQRVGMSSSLNPYNGQNNLTDISNSITQQLGSYTVPLTGSVLQSTVTWSYNNIVAAIIDAQNKLHILASDDLFNQYSQGYKISYLESIQEQVDSQSQTFQDLSDLIGDLGAQGFTTTNTLANLIGDRNNWTSNQTMIDCLIPLGNLSTLNYNNVSTLAAILGNLYNCNFNTYVPTSQITLPTNIQSLIGDLNGLFTQWDTMYTNGTHIESLVSNLIQLNYKLGLSSTISTSTYGQNIIDRQNNLINIIGTGLQNTTTAGSTIIDQLTYLFKNISTSTSDPLIGDLSTQGFTTANTLALSLGNLVSNGYNLTSSLSNVLGNLSNQGYTSSNNLAILLGNLSSAGFSSQKSLATFIGNRSQWTSSDSLITVVNNLVQNSGTITIEGLGDLTAQNFTTSNTLATFIGDRDQYTNTTYPTIISALNAILTDKSNGYGSSSQQPTIEGLGVPTSQNYSSSDTVVDRLGDLNAVLINTILPNNRSYSIADLLQNYISFIQIIDRTQLDKYYASLSYQLFGPLSTNTTQALIYNTIQDANSVLYPVSIIQQLGSTLVSQTLTNGQYLELKSETQQTRVTVTSSGSNLPSLATILGELYAFGYGRELSVIGAILGNLQQSGFTGYYNNTSLAQILGNLVSNNFTSTNTLATFIGDRNNWTQSKSLIETVEELVRNGSSSQPTTIEGLGTPTNQGYSNTSTLVDIIGNLTTNNFTSTNTLAKVLGDRNNYTLTTSVLQNLEALGDLTQAGFDSTHTLISQIGNYNLLRQNAQLDHIANNLAELLGTQQLYSLQVSSLNSYDGQYKSLGYYVNQLSIMGNVLIDSGKNRYLSLYNIFGSLVRNVLTNGSFISKDDNIFGTQDTDYATLSDCLGSLYANGYGYDAGGSISPRQPGLAEILGNLYEQGFVGTIQSGNTNSSNLANVLGNLISNGYTADNNLASFLGNRSSINTKFTSTVAQTINQFNLDRDNQFMIDTNLTENDSGWIQSGPIINNKFELNVITSQDIMTFNNVVYNSYFYITFQDNVQLEINATNGTINVVNCIFYLNVDETITETEILHAIGDMKFINCTFLATQSYVANKTIFLEVGDQNIINVYGLNGLMTGENTVQTNNLAAQVAEIQNTLDVIQ